MTEHAKHTAGRGGDRADREQERRADQEQRRRTVDEDAPAAEGLTSPGEGADDAPSEPRQSKDYA